jgi:hypothetical protein
MKVACEEIFVQSRDVREFLHRSIPAITSLEHDKVFLPEGSLWSPRHLSAPESKLSLIESLFSFISSNLRALTTRIGSSYRRYASRNFPRSGNV